jgi:hypothetical protein
MWNTLLEIEYQRQLLLLDSRVNFWPASWMKDSGYNSAIPIEWWISFSNNSAGLIWSIKYPTNSRVIQC